MGYRYIWSQQVYAVTENGNNGDAMHKERASGVKVKDLMSEYSLSKASAYRLLRVGLKWL